ARLQPPRDLEGAGAGTLRLPPRRARIRGAPHGRYRLRPGPPCGEPGRPGVHPGGDRVPEDAEGHVPSHRRPRPGGARSAPRGRHPRGGPAALLLMAPGTDVTRRVVLPASSDLLTLLGRNDEHLRALESQYDVRIVARGHELTLAGGERQVAE